MRSDKHHQRNRFWLKTIHVQVEAWMINNIIFTSNTPQAPFMEGLDSRKILSQPGENDIKA